MINDIPFLHFAFLIGFIALISAVLQTPLVWAGKKIGFGIEEKLKFHQRIFLGFIGSLIMVGASAGYYFLAKNDYAVKDLDQAIKDKYSFVLHLSNLTKTFMEKHPETKLIYGRISAEANDQEEIVVQFYNYVSSKKLENSTIDSVEIFKMSRFVEEIEQKNLEIAEIEKKLTPYIVKEKDTHWNIAKNFLVSEASLSQDKVNEILSKTVLIDRLYPGFYIFNYWHRGVFLTTVTQGKSEISKAKLRASIGNRGTTDEDQQDNLKPVSVLIRRIKSYSEYAHNLGYFIYLRYPGFSYDYGIMGELNSKTNIYYKSNFKSEARHIDDLIPEYQSVTLLPENYKVDKSINIVIELGRDYKKFKSKLY